MNFLAIFAAVLREPRAEKLLTAKGAKKTLEGVEKTKFKICDELDLPVDIESREFTFPGLVKPFGARAP
jgi:hypothetical protein